MGNCGIENHWADLRQNLLQLQLTSSHPSQLSMRMLEWLPATLESLNAFIESAYSHAAVMLQRYQLIK